MFRIAKEALRLGVGMIQAAMSGMPILMKMSPLGI